MTDIKADAPGAVTGLILSGGGARAAYQVGVLSAIADLLPDPQVNPFPVIVGTSAGAINAVSLASGASHFGEAVRRLVQVWQGFRTHQVYRSDWQGVMAQASRFIGNSLLGWGARRPVALLDSTPLAELLERELDFNGVATSIRQQHLQAVAVTAFGYESSQAITFYQGRSAIEPWFRHRRVGVPTRLSHLHLMASSAIPLLFPPVKINREYFGDGAVRQSAPISPALHLGANRVLVIGVSGKTSEAEDKAARATMTGKPPSLAQIGGHLLNSTFIDSLEGDLEQLERLNYISRLAANTESVTGHAIKPVEVLVIAPSQSIGQIAARHRRELPAMIRLFLQGPGATRNSGAGALSYLLFEQGYCSELIELGYRDAMAKRDRLCAFLGFCSETAAKHPGPVKV